MQFHLFYKYIRKRKSISGLRKSDVKDESLPSVTVQLPIYNELFVVERLIDCILKFEYPKNKLEIQVLDDSTDETKEIIARKVLEYKEMGYDIKHIHRTDRSGYKAGALKEGTKVANGKFIAIFDADFLPDADFLLKTIPYFEDREIGVVQTRWAHINENYSLLTRVQALQLNVHFTVEQTGRELNDYFLQFNGTAGVWRKETIIDAGGWQPDTLTEDLDLSYRAQLRGWKFHFLEGVGSPSELPVEMNGLKSQQYRWMKGGAETAKKLMPKVMSADIPIFKKVHAMVHLFASSIFLFIIVFSVLSVPLIYALNFLGYSGDYYGIFVTGLVSILIIYVVGNMRIELSKGDKVKRGIRTVFLFPLFLSLSMGLALHNSIAIIQGYLGKKTPFVRTPKFNIKTNSDSFSRRIYRLKSTSILTYMEGFLAFFFMGGIILGFVLHDFSFIVLHILLAFGYGSIFVYTIKHSYT